MTPNAFTPDAIDKQLGGLTITAPEGAVCGLYPSTPSSTNYHKAIDPQNAIPATRVTTADSITAYYYGNLETGTYHCGVSMDGYNAVCQVIYYTAEKAASGAQLDIRLDPLAGNGFEAGYVMLCTPEFTNAHMASQKDTWGREYARLFQTPIFLREAGRPGCHQQTTNEELMDFIAKLDTTNDNMHVFSLGKSPKYGYDMPLVLFTRENVAGKTLEQAAEIVRSNGKPTVQYTAQCHATEPASCEGALTMMLELCGDYGKQVLDAADVYIVPRINLDGAYEVTRKSPTTGEDMNRDYLYMHNAEIRMVTTAYNLFLPEVAIDGHEKRDNVYTAEDALCTDMELMVGAGSLNHPAVMTELAMQMALSALAKGRAFGLRGHFYTKLASAAGGSAGSSYYGTRNSLSFLVETPGQSPLGSFFMERRVMAHYVLASTVINYTVEHPQEVMDTVRASREKMIRTGATYDENDVIVLEHGKGESGFWSTPLINVPSGKVTDPDHTIAYTEHTVALRTRPRATAYIIPQGLAHEKEILRVTRNHEINHYALPAGSIAKVQQYIQKDTEVSLTEEHAVCFEQGAFVFPNTVPSTILGVIMEPDFSSSSGRKMTLLSMGLLDADEGGCLPIFRYCHNLVDGKVSVE